MHVLTAQVLQTPECVHDLDPPAWTRLIVEARSLGLVGRLGARLAGRGLLDSVPDGPRRHLDGMARFAAKQQADVMHEVRHVRDTLVPQGIPVVLMKGAAYVAAGRAAAEGRIFEDIDLLVPENQIVAAEAALTAAGWTRSALSDHDTRYYYEWMHQIPPLVHVERESVLDVHHNIVPRTAAPQIDAAALVHAAEPTTEPGVYTLAPADMVLHSALHLFNEGEFDRGLRDLSDLDLLLREIGRADPGLERLRRRARTLGLDRPLGYALRMTSAFFQTPLPPSGLGADSTAGLTERFLTACFRRAVLPPGMARWPGREPVRFFLYVRGHLLKMPLRLLLPHLATKLVAGHRDHYDGAANPMR
jgi:hypothetical protein